MSRPFVERAGKHFNVITEPEVIQEIREIEKESDFDWTKYVDVNVLEQRRLKHLKQSVAEASLLSRHIIETRVANLNHVNMAMRLAQLDSAIKDERPLLSELQSLCGMIEPLVKRIKDDIGLTTVLSDEVILVNHLDEMLDTFSELFDLMRARNTKRA